MTAPRPAAPLLRLEGVTKSFGASPAVDGVSLEIGQGEFFALLGPSGCGKTTLMRMIAGLEQPDSGRICLEGEDICGLPAHQRPINMMFQSYALFPHLTVARNVAFGLEQAHLPRKEIEARVDDLLKLMQLSDFAGRKPAQLSGGQKQRVALARALARRPKLLLLDEPLAALDRKLREATQFELRDVQRRLGASFMLVTHDQEEAMAMAQRIGVMRAGRIEQIGTPEDLYERPANRWVASFIGEANLFETVVEEKTQDWIVVRGEGGERFEVVEQGAAFRLGDRTTLVLRPERVSISDEAAPESFGCGEVIDQSYRGQATLWMVRLASGKVVRLIRSHHGAQGERLVVGARIWLGCGRDAARLCTE